MPLNNDPRRRGRASLLALALTCTACLVADPADYRSGPPATATSSSSTATPESDPMTDLGPGRQR